MSDSPLSATNRKIWFVDDLEANRQTWLASFSQSLKSRHVLRAFADVESLMQALQSETPDLLFLDFFIGERAGHELIDSFQGKSPRPVLIAHSSMARANQALLDHGADLILEKVKGAIVTASIVSLIRTDADLEALIQRFRA